MSDEIIEIQSPIYIVQPIEGGLTGPTGPKGDTGGAGAQGATGASGIDGDDGSQGIPGNPGATGPDGTNGSDGVDGATGATGPQGEQGTAGPTGAAGINGSNGVDGATGPTGSTGSTGPQGDQGTAGTTGAAGINGSNGVDGADGATGPTGSTGSAGEQGASGEQGVPGEQGVQGESGTTGAAGADGSSGAAGVDGQLKRVDSKLNAPPVSPATGLRHIVGGAPTGAWAAFTEDNLALYNGSAWVEETALLGEKVWGTDEELELIKRASAWYALISSHTLHYQGSNSTAVDAGRWGRMNSASSNYAAPFPDANHEWWVLYSELAIETGATAGTYTVSQSIKEYGAAPDAVLKWNTVSTTATNSYIRQVAAGTLLNPVLEVKFTNTLNVRVGLGWYNEPTSPGSLVSGAHSSWCSGMMVKKVVI